MNYTIKAILINNYLYLRYTFNRQRTKIKIANIKDIDIKNFDSKKGYFNSNILLNSLIREQTDFLETFVESVEDKTHINIKTNFQNFLDNKKLKQRQSKSAGKALKIIEYVEFQDLLKQEKNLEQQLIEIKKQIFLYNNIGHQTEEEIKFRMLLDDYLLTFDHKAEGNKTKSQVKSWIKTLKEFSNKTNTSLSFKNMNQAFYNSYGKYLMFDSKHKLFNPTFSQHIKKLKTFLNWCVREEGVEMVTKYKSWKMWEAEKEMIILSEFELKMLWDYKDKLTLSQQKIIDLTWFQSYTGLRISDVFNSKWDLEMIKNRNVLSGICIKNKGAYLVDLNYDVTGRTTEILKKYNFKLNLFTDKHYNETIKTILKEVFEANNYVKADKEIIRYRFDKKFTTIKSWVDLFSSHSNRKYFINYLVSLNTSETTILQIIGSASISELKRAYIDKEEETILANSRRSIDANNKKLGY